MKLSYLNDDFFSRLETLELNLRKDLLGYFGGKHLVSTYGQTVEFADYREYQLGDDIRRIDWNLYSRFEKYYLKLFTDERQMQVQIFLDCSASMGKDNPRKSAYAVAVAAAMGYLSIHNMDKVSFKLMKGNACEDPFGLILGKNAFFRSVNLLSETVFDNETDMEAAVKSCPNLGTGNGLAIVISDFFTDSDWKKTVDYLCYLKKQVLLIQVLTPEEIEPSYSGRVNLIDLEAADMADERNMKMKITNAMLAAYDEALRSMREELKTFSASRGAEFITLRTDVPVEKTLFSDLLKVGIVG